MKESKGLANSYIDTNRDVTLVFALRHIMDLISTSGNIVNEEREEEKEEPYKKSTKTMRENETKNSLEQEFNIPTNVERLQYRCRVVSCVFGLRSEGVLGVREIKEAQVIAKKTIKHSSDPAHPLAMLCSETESLCNGCRTPGVGSWHSSQSRSVNLHDYCASCPATLSSFMHPHPLTLTEQEPQAQCLNQRQCSLCHDYVLGLFYTCKDCNFHVHPICTQLPEHLHHVVDRFHSLRLLQPSPIPACCAVCAAPCTSWHYGCVACGLHIHLHCVLTPFALPTPYSSFPPQPQPQPPPYGGFANYGYGCPPYGCGHGFAPAYPVSNNQPPLGSGHGVTSAYPVSNNQPPLGSGHGYVVPPHHDHSYAHHGNANHNEPQAQAQFQAQDQAQVSGSMGGRICRNMFALVGSLVMGVLSNVIFGLLN